KRQQLPRRHRDALRVPAAGEQRAHLVPYRPAGDARPELGDPSRALKTGVVGDAGRRIVAALPLEEVGTVDPGRRHIDQYLTLARHRVGNLGPAQYLGAARFGNRDCVHAPTLPAGRLTGPERAATDRPTPPDHRPPPAPPARTPARRG